MLPSVNSQLLSTDLQRLHSMHMRYVYFDWGMCVFFVLDRCRIQSALYTAGTGYVRLNDRRIIWIFAVQVTTIWALNTTVFMCPARHIRSKLAVCFVRFFCNNNFYLGKQLGGSGRNETSIVNVWLIGLLKSFYRFNEFIGRYCRKDEQRYESRCVKICERCEQSRCARRRIEEICSRSIDCI